MNLVGVYGAVPHASGAAPNAFVAPMSVPVFAGGIRAAMTVTRGATKLAFLFVFNMFVLFAGAGRAVAVA